MADKQQYQQMLERAKAANDAEAVAYFQSKLAGEGSDKLEFVAPAVNVTPQANIPQRSTAGQLLHGAEVGSRSVLEGASSILDIPANALNAAYNMITPESWHKLQNVSVGGSISSALGLDQPETPIERVGGNVLGAMTGTGAARKVAQLATPSTDAGQIIKSALVENPVAQQVAAVGASGAGGATREAGGGVGLQTVASILGGVAAPTSVKMAKSTATGIADAASKFFNKPNAIQSKVDVALANHNIKTSDLPVHVANQLSQDIAEAIKINGRLDNRAVQALVDYRITGATPTKGTLTLDPATITRERNLAKQGINSDDPQAQKLGRLQNENNQILLTKLNQIGAENAVNDYDIGSSLIGRLKAYGTQAKQNISDLYTAATDSQGRSAKLDNYKFSQSAGDLLDKNNANAFLPTEFKSTLNKIANGELPLTINVAEQIKSQLATSMRSATDGNVRAAMGYMRQALDETPLLKGQGVGEDALNAFISARKANRDYMKELEANPSLSAAMNDVQPDKFFDKYVLKSTANDLDKMLSLMSQDAKDAVKNNVIAYIKNKATRFNPDETAIVSADAMDSAIRSIGSKKMESLFSKDELTTLKAVLNVAKRERFQPAGSAVNNSNTASTAIDSISRMVSKIPFGKVAIADPLKSYALDRGAGIAMNVPRSIVNPLEPNAAPFPLISLLQERNQ